MSAENDVSPGAVAVMLVLFAALVVVGVVTVALPELANDASAPSADAGAEPAATP